MEGSIPTDWGWSASEEGPGKQFDARITCSPDGKITMTNLSDSSQSKEYTSPEQFSQEMQDFAQTGLTQAQS